MGQSLTSLSLPVATSKTKPRNEVVLVTNGEFLIRVSDCFTSSSTSGNDSADHGGLTPISSWMPALEVVVGERQHAAVGVVDQDDLGGPEQALADGQGPDLVVGDHAARVADDVCLAVLESEDAVDVEPGVHTRDHRDVPTRWQRQWAGEALRVGAVVLQVFVGNSHALMLGAGPVAHKVAVTVIETVFDGADLWRSPRRDRRVRLRGSRGG